jgi:hypothetical protein
MPRKLLLFAGTGVLLAAVFFGIQIYASTVAEKKVDETLAKVSALVDIDYGKVSFELIGMDVRISDVRIAPVNSGSKTRISEVVIRGIDDKSEVPAFLSLSCRGIEIDARQLKGASERLKELGYPDTLLCSLDIDYRYDRERKELTVERLAIGARDAGELDIRLQLANVNLDPKEAIGLLFTYPQIMVAGARIRYKDQSLAQRLMELKAREEKSTLKDYRNGLIRSVDQQIEREKDDFARGALIEVKRFIDDPRTLSLSVSPAKPQPVGRIMRANGAKDLVKLLNIEISP